MDSLFWFWNESKNQLFWHEFWTKLQILGKRCMLRAQMVKKYFCPMKNRNFSYTGLLCATKYMARTWDQRQSILAIFSNFPTGNGGQNGWNWLSLILCPDHILDRTAKSSISKILVFHRAKMLIYHLGPKDAAFSQNLHFCPKFVSKKLVFALTPKLAPTVL